MFNKTLLAAGLAAAIALPSAAQAQESSSPWYFGINFNVVDVDDVDSLSTEAVAGVDRNLVVDTDTDTGFGIKFGRKLFTSSAGHRFSVELSYNELSTDVDAIVFQGTLFEADLGAAAGEIETETILLRALYQFETGAVDPYIGIGVGQTDLDIEAVYGGSAASVPGTQPPFAFNGDDAFSIQFRVGAEYSFSDRFGIYLEYTRTETDDIEFQRLGGGPGGLALTTQEADLDADSINFGFNFRF